MFLLLQTAAAIAFRGQTVLTAGESEEQRKPIFGTTADAMAMAHTSHLRQKVQSAEQDAWDKYIKSDAYKEDKDSNVAWVKQTNGTFSPQCAPHYETMMLPGRAHLFRTHVLYVWSQFAEQRNISWVVDGGTLLGFERNEDFIPHDKDVDAIVRQSDMPVVWRELTKQRPGLFEIVRVGWPGFQVRPLQKAGDGEQAQYLSKLYMDLFCAYEPEEGKRDFENCARQPEEGNQIRERVNGDLAGSKIWKPLNAAAVLEAYYCEKKDSDDCAKLMTAPYEMRPAEYSNKSVGPSMVGSQWCAMAEMPELPGLGWRWWCVVIGTPVGIMLTVLVIAYCCLWKKGGAKSANP